MARIPEELRIITHPLTFAEEPAKVLAAKRGDLIHVALSLIERVPSQKELEGAIRRAFILLGEDERRWRIREDFLRPLERIFEMEQVKDWFAEGTLVLREMEVVDEEGGLHRLDRVVVKEGLLEVIEYKVGHREGWHVGQVREYMRLLREIFPGTIRGFILYIDEAAVLEV